MLECVAILGRRVHWREPGTKGVPQCGGSCVGVGFGIGVGSRLPRTVLGNRNATSDGRMLDCATHLWLLPRRPTGDSDCVGTVYSMPVLCWGGYIDDDG